MKKTMAMLACMLVAPAYAQQGPVVQAPAYPEGVTEQAGCWLGSMRFSPGSRVNSGNGVMLCHTDFVWVADDGDASGCIREGDFHSVGDVQKLPSSATMVTCGVDGRWSASIE